MSGLKQLKLRGAETFGQFLCANRGRFAFGVIFILGLYLSTWLFWDTLKDSRNSGLLVLLSPFALPAFLMEFYVRFRFLKREKGNS